MITARKVLVEQSVVNKITLLIVLSTKDNHSYLSFNAVVDYWRVNNVIDRHLWREFSDENEIDYI